MKKFYVLVLCLLVFSLLLTGCLDSARSDEVSFNAIVIENNQTHLLVEPEEGSSELSSADRITIAVSKAVLLNSQDAEVGIADIKAGDRIQVFYNGVIAESYPAQINGCHKVKILEAVSASSDYTEKIAFENGFYRPDPDSLPEEIANWISCSLEIPSVQEKMHDGYRFVLVTEGRKPSGGYEVEVEGCPAARQAGIKIRSTAPAEGEAVDTVITSPFDLIIVEEKELPLSFLDVNDRNRYFMRMHGIETIEQPFVASSDWIKIFSPKPDEQVQGAISLSGIACVFEGTVSYELLNEDDRVLSRGFTTATMGDWGYFEEIIPVPADIDADRLVLQLYSESGKDGSKMFVVEIPLVIGGGF